MSDPAAATHASAYNERLTVPIRWWVQATMFIATIWLAFIVATPGWVAWATTGLCAALAALMFVNIGRATIAVRDGVLQAGNAHIDASFLGEPEILDAEQTRLAAGRDVDVRAFLLLRPYLKQSVKVPLHDPRDPAPYWLMASRRPGELAAVLSRAVEQHAGVSGS